MLAPAGEKDAEESYTYTDLRTVMPISKHITDGKNCWQEFQKQKRCRKTTFVTKTKAIPTPTDLTGYILVTYPISNRSILHSGSE